MLVPIEPVSPFEGQLMKLERRIGGGLGFE